MTTLNARVAALEQVSQEIDTEPMFIHFVGFDDASEIQRITKGNQAWQRQPDESEQDLNDRSLRETDPAPNGCKLVFLCH